MSGNKKKKLFVLDTNVILHDSSCIYKFGEHDIVVPIQVIEELDNFKKGFETVNFHSREFCRVLDELSGGHIFNGGVSLGEGLGKLRIHLVAELQQGIKENLRTINVDAEIINLAFYLKTKEQNKNKEIIIVSKDTNLRMKAKALGVLAQDFLSERVENIDFLSEKVKEIKTSLDVIQSLYNSHDEVTHVIKGALANENFILKNGSSSVLVRYNGKGKVKKITKDKLVAFNVKPKNSEQAFTMDAMLDPLISIVTVEGKAGTGKTIISLACALALMEAKKYSKVFFTRQAIEVGEKMGFLPGDADEKISPYMKGMKDNLEILKEMGKNKDFVNQSEMNNKIVIEALSFIRGRSLPGIFWIIDEAQNLTPHQVKTIITRAGEGTKIVFIGDTHQIDHPYLDQRSNGFSYLIQKFKGQDCYSHIHLVKSERSALAELAGELL